MRDVLSDESGNTRMGGMLLGDEAQAARIREALEGQFVCPFCGAATEGHQTVCPKCTMENTPAARKATKSRIGPWYVLQARNPAAPGMKWETLLGFVRKGRIKPQSIVRGPTTHQLWRFAAHVKALSREFGVCYSCGGAIDPAANLCPQCNRLQEPPINPDTLLEGGEIESRLPVYKEIPASAAAADPQWAARNLEIEEARAAEKQKAIEKEQALEKAAALLREQQEAAARERDAVQRERETAARAREAVTRELEAATRERETAAREREELLRQREQILREREEVTRQRDEMIREREDMMRQRDEVTREREQITGELEQAAREREAIEREKQSAAAELEAIRLEQEAIARERAMAVQERDAAAQQHQTLSQSREAVERERDTIERERSAIEREREMLNQEREAVLRQREAAVHDREAATRERAAMAHDREAAAREREAAARERELLRNEAQLRESGAGAAGATVAATAAAELRPPVAAVERVPVAAGEPTPAVERIPAAELRSASGSSERAVEAPPVRGATPLAAPASESVAEEESDKSPSVWEASESPVLRNPLRPQPARAGGDKPTAEPPAAKPRPRDGFLSPKDLAAAFKLNFDPAAKFDEAQSLVADLAPSEANVYGRGGMSGAPPRPRRAVRWKLAAYVLILGAVAAGVAADIHQHGGSLAPNQPSSHVVRPRVDVPLAPGAGHSAQLTPHTAAPSEDHSGGSSPLAPTTRASAATPQSTTSDHSLVPQGSAASPSSTGPLSSGNVSGKSQEVSGPSQETSGKSPDAATQSTVVAQTRPSIANDSSSNGNSPTDSRASADARHQARVLYEQAIEAEDRTDFAEAVKIYEQIRSLPKEDWPTPDLETRLKLARAQQNQK